MRAAIVALLLCLALPATAAPNEAIDGRRLNALMADYYLAPDPASAFDWLLRVEAGVLQRPEAVDLVATFLSHVLRAAPDRAADFIDDVATKATSGPVVLTVATAVWLADLPRRQVYLERLRATGKLSETEAMRLIRSAAFDSAGFMPLTAHDLDLCWASFYATGDSGYVEKVARHLPYLLPKDVMQELAQRSEPGAQQLFERGLVARAAAWSLASHARQHERVRLVLVDLSSLDVKMGKAVKALLDDVFRTPAAVR